MNVPGDEAKQRLRPRRVIGIVLVAVVLLLGVTTVAIVTAVPEPRLPPLLRGLAGVGGDTTVCPPATEQEAASRRRFVQSPTAWSPELGRRLEREFPPGSDAKRLVEQLQQLGFMLIGSCKGDPDIRSALFRQHGGFVLRPSGLPMTATIWWQVDDSERLIWAKGMVAYDGL